MTANHSRRRFLLWSAAGTTIAAFAGQAGLATPQQQQGPVRPLPPNSNPDPNLRRDPSEAGDGSAPVPDPKGVLKANDKDIKQNVEKLAGLADELKKEVEATDSANVLSLTMVHKAEEIEKLARHIASLARG